MKTQAEKLRDDARLLADTEGMPAETIALLREIADATEARTMVSALTVPVPRAFLDAAVCPECDGSGFNVSTGPDPQQEQCQWCYEKHMLLQGAEVVPTGWKLVPIEPTDEMRIAGGKYRDEAGGRRTVGGYWRAMISATPKP